MVKCNVWPGNYSLLSNHEFSAMDVALSAYDLIGADAFYDDNDSHADPNEVIPDSLIDWLD